MRDPRPVFWLCVVQMLALLALVGWWCGRTPGERVAALGAVMVGEQVPTVPPEGLAAQAAWLSTHRRQRLTSMAGVLVLAGIIGVGEGIARRRADVLGGFLLRWWTTGVVGLALLPGVLVGSLLVPWPVPGWAVASGLALLVALVMYGLLAGRPYVP
jgi:hypothetical protein